MDTGELADQFAIRDLINRYAHHADRRQPAEQAAIFTLDGRVRLYEGDPVANEPVDVITGRANLARTFAKLISQYHTTTYLNGQTTLVLDGDVATGETYCLAMHLLDVGTDRMLLTMSIRYLDSFARTAEGWRISDRQLVFDWTDRRPSQP